ncbi:MAG: hypothetical protein ACR2N9_09105 [Acidimicrobiia bacterium]
MTETGSGLIVSERPGSERVVPIATLVDHPGALPDASTVASGRRGRAVPVRLVLSTNQPFVVATDVAGDYVACIPTVDMIHGGHLLVGTSDEPLTSDEGGPVRLIVAEGATLCWNVKHVASLEGVPDRVPDSVPANPKH